MSGWTAEQERHANNLIRKVLTKYSQFNCTDVYGTIPLNQSMSYEIPDPNDPTKKITVTRVINLTENLTRGPQAYNMAVGNRIKPSGIMCNVVATAPTDKKVQETVIALHIAQTSNKNLPTPSEYWDSSIGSGFAPLGFRNPSRVSDYTTLTKMFFSLSYATNNGRMFSTYIKGKEIIELTTTSSADAMGKAENLESGGLFCFAVSDIFHVADTEATEEPHLDYFFRTTFANNALSVSEN